MWLRFFMQMKSPIDGENRSGFSRREGIVIKKLNQYMW